MTLSSGKCVEAHDGDAIDAEYERLSPEGKAQVDRAMRNCERRERRERFGDPEKFDRFTGSYMTIGEEFGQ